jgi:hypothetical protein
LVADASSGESSGPLRPSVLRKMRSRGRRH